MFSFFTKKKQSPDAPVIQGPAAEPQNNSGDDFIFVDKKSDDNPPLPQRSMYPPMPAPYGASPYPRFPYGPGNPSGAAIPTTPPPVSYVQDVPFALAPQLCTKTTLDATQTEVDGILAILTRQMSVGVEEEYNFALERSIQNESY